MISFKDFRKKIGDHTKKLAKAAVAPAVKHDDVEAYAYASEILKRVKHDPNFKPGMDPFRFDGSKLPDHIHKKFYSESEELDEAIKGWKHAHTDIIKSRAAASAAAKPIQLRRLTSKGVESKMSSTEQSAFSSHEDAQKHVDNMHQMNPGKKFSYNKYVEGKHVGVITKSTNESEELDESGWISGISKWKEAVNAKHGHALPTFKKVSQPGSPGKSTTYATSSQTGNIIGVYQHHNKSGTVHESVELDESATRFIQKVNQAANAAASGKHKNAQMHLDNARSFMLGVKSTDMEKIKDAHETYKNLRKKYSGSGGNFTPSHNQVGNAKVLD